jgi:hypothetical protein
MNTTKKLFHITDVGAPSGGSGVDSSLRIVKQYQRLGASVKVVSAGHSPLHVAFTACTDLSQPARERVGALLEKIGFDRPTLPPMALNCAPRNSVKTFNNGQEKSIFRVTRNGAASYLIYGPEVLRWVLVFNGQDGVKVEEIGAIPGFIEDTSTGSQFRSGEHLPIVHFLESQGLLAEYSQREEIKLDQIPAIFENHHNTIVIAPSDEFGNGRVILSTSLMEKIFTKKSILIPEVSDQKLDVQSSLTTVVPGKLSIWPSSNHFPNPDIGVVNLGTRWKPDTTTTTDNAVIKLIEKLFNQVGHQYQIDL